MESYNLTNEQLEEIKKQARSECARKAVLVRHAKMSAEEKTELGRRLNAAVQANKAAKVNTMIDDTFADAPVIDAEKPFEFKDDDNPTSR